MCLTYVLIEIIHPYLSGMWLVWLQERMSERHVFKRSFLCVQNMITNLSLVVNVIGGAYMTI